MGVQIGVQKGSRRGPEGDQKGGSTFCTDPGKARQGKARQGKARQGKARQARQGRAGQGRAGQGRAGQGSQFMQTMNGVTIFSLCL